MSSSEIASGLPVPVALQRSAHRDRKEWIDSGVFAVDLLTRTMGGTDLSGVEMLDVGCGTKIVKTLLDNGLPVGRYVGIDAYAPVIDFLKANVTDPRFEFAYFDARNDLYNPEGTPLGDFERLPVGADPFDLICLFSVFTHLGPDDYVSMLRLTRRHIKPDGTLLFSLYLNDPEHPSLIAQQLAADVKSDDPLVAETARRAIAKALAAKDRGFLDEVPEQPLLRALYDVDFAHELFDGTGWEAVSVHPPEQHIQHYMICRPV
jgi:SAM-dependent methyltransferase